MTCTGGRIRGSERQRRLRRPRYRWDRSLNWRWSTRCAVPPTSPSLMVEIDAIVAIMLSITSEELTTIYRTPVPGAAKYDADALYDARPRRLPANSP